MQRTFMFAVSAVAMTWAANALADSPNLQGAYAFTGTAACLVAPGSGLAPAPGNTTPFANANFNGYLQPIYPTNAFSHSFSVEGIRTFNGDGTGTVTGTSLGITVRPTPAAPGYPAFPPSADTTNFSFKFTYTINHDGGWTATMVPGSYNEIFVAGPRSTENPANVNNQTATIDAIPPMTGLISQDGQTLIVAHTAAVVETATYSNGDVWPRICHRSRVLISLGNGHQDSRQEDR
jgi:hypothetical protein